MKLAEALLLRTDLQKKITELETRIKPVLIVHGMRSPQEDPLALLDQLRKLIYDYESIIIRINKTNNTTKFDGHSTLMEALSERDALKLLIEKLRNIRQAAVLENKGVEKLKANIDTHSLQIEIDQMGRAFRELDNKIQTYNWTTELQ